MAKFVIPISFAELEYATDGSLGADELFDVGTMDDDERAELMKQCRKSLSGSTGSALNILDQKTFNSVYSLASHAKGSEDCLRGSECVKLIRLLEGALSNLLGLQRELQEQRRPDARNAVKALVYFITQLVVKVDKASGPQGHAALRVLCVCTRH